MQFVVEICHPNDVFSGVWESVEYVDSKKDLIDLIQSPTFDVYDGLLLQCVSLGYVGAFRDNTCVDLSRNSDIVFKIEKSLMKNFGLDESFVSFWTTTKSPSDALGSIIPFIPIEKARDFAWQCVQKIKHMIPEDLSSALSKNHDDAANILCHDVNSLVLDEPKDLRRDALLCVQAYLSTLASDRVRRSYANASVYMGLALNMPLPEMMRFIRKQMPFHHVIQWVTTS